MHSRLSVDSARRQELRSVWPIVRRPPNFALRELELFFMSFLQPHHGVRDFKGVLNLHQALLTDYLYFLVFFRLPALRVAPLLGPEAARLDHRVCLVPTRLVGSVVVLNRCVGLSPARLRRPLRAPSVSCSTHFLKY